MARIVIASVPATGHVTPLLPIARALVAAGHELRWLGGTKHAQRIAATGARFVPFRAAPDIDEARLNEAFPGRAGRKGLAAIKFDLRHIFLGLAPAMLQDLDALHAEQGMDLLFADVPYPMLLPKTRVMVSNGGFGGVQLALGHGVPLAVAGDSEDKPEVAARVAYADAGIDLRTGRPSARQIAHAVRRLLHEPALRARAAQLAAEYARYDAVQLALAHVDRLLARG